MLFSKYEENHALLCDIVKCTYPIEMAKLKCLKFEICRQNLPT